MFLFSTHICKVFFIKCSISARKGCKQYYVHIIVIIIIILLFSLNGRTLISTNGYVIFFEVWCQQDSSHLNKILEDSAGMY